VRATYQREAERVIIHLHSIGITRIAVLYVDDSFGTDGLAGALRGFNATKFDPAVVEKFDRVKPDFSSGVSRVLKANSQAVLIIAAGGAVVEGVKAIRAAGSTAQVVTLSNNASVGFVTSLGNLAPGVVVSQVFPNERSIAYPLIKEAREMAKATGVEISPALLEGFAAAKVLVEALRRAGPKPDRIRLQAALENLKKLDIGGLEISYGPDDHTGLDFSDLSIIGTDGKFKR
jgi:branched-chain amino acid transport system substrate-binding protein